MIEVKKNLVEKTGHVIAKTNREDSTEWLPLWMHLADTAGIMEYLIEQWLPDSTKKFIQESVPEEKLVMTGCFLGAIHDIGKCTAVFQSRIGAELPDIKYILSQEGIELSRRESYYNGSQTPHALAGYAILLEYGCPEGIASIVGAHHGKPADFSSEVEDQIEIYPENYFGFDENDDIWTGLWDDYLKFALQISGAEEIEDLPDITMPCQVVLSGLLVMADWIASNSYYFPLISVEENGMADDYPYRIAKAWEVLNLTQGWNPLCYSMDQYTFHDRFGFEANEIQREVLDAVQSSSDPGIFILEAQMGVGKTEAALAAAELLATGKGSGGLYFGLPTQATANGIFERLESWALKQSEEDQAVHGIRLAHGMAELNEDYRELFRGTAFVDDEENGLLVHPWFKGRKQALLTDFVIGTVDQLLMMALKQKHVMLRHLGLAGKVVIIDECHAYDAYMNQYLDMALTWLGEYHVPVILLSATLPEKRREELVKAYLDGEDGDTGYYINQKYPLLTWTDHGKINQKALSLRGNKKKISINRISDDTLTGTLLRELKEGGCAGVIVNTVIRAQNLAENIRKQMPDFKVIVFHAQFTATDRREKEKILLEILGKKSTQKQRDKIIVVGTQVLEQSLDIDFDVLITDLCPMDLLLQRMGRLHRHEWRKRPDGLKQPECYILGALEEEFEGGAKAIYGEWLLLQTKSYLKQSVTLPDDIPGLVQEVYKYPQEDNFKQEKERAAWSEFKANREKLQHSAEGYRIAKPVHSRRIKTMDNWLSTTLNVNDKLAEASVRSGNSSPEVLVMYQKGDESIHFLPWVHEGEEVPVDWLPDEATCRKIAGQRLRLPGRFSKFPEKVINELEERNRTVLGQWQESGWLRGELVLLLDENLSAELCGYRLFYTREEGLHCEEEGMI